VNHTARCCCLPQETSATQPARSPTFFFCLFSFLSATKDLWIRLAVLISLCQTFDRIRRIRLRVARSRGGSGDRILCWPLLPDFSEHECGTTRLRDHGTAKRGADGSGVPQAGLPPVVAPFPFRPQDSTQGERFSSVLRAMTEFQRPTVPPPHLRTASPPHRPTAYFSTRNKLLYRSVNSTSRPSNGRGFTSRMI
jgi:hypothetical protein